MIRAISRMLGAHDRVFIDAPCHRHREVAQISHQLSLRRVINARIKEPLGERRHIGFQTSKCSLRDSKGSSVSWFLDRTDRTMAGG